MRFKSHRDPCSYNPGYKVIELPKLATIDPWQTGLVMKLVYKAAEAVSTMLCNVPTDRTHDQPSTTRGVVGFDFD
jgi:hypothetical protein